CCSLPSSSCLPTCSSASTGKTCTDRPLFRGTSRAPSWARAVFCYSIIQVRRGHGRNQQVGLLFRSPRPLFPSRALRARRERRRCRLHGGGAWPPPIEGG